MFLIIVQQGIVMSGKYDVGTVHETKHCGKLRIIKYIDPKQRRVKFLETGYITTVKVSAIYSGSVKDPRTPTVCGVGFLGDHDQYKDHPLYELLYSRWYSMLRRCFQHGYKPVEPSWLVFSTFMSDALGLPGVDLLYTHTKENQIDLDSDILAVSRGVKPMYSKETCQWIPRAVNAGFTVAPRSTQRYRKGNIFLTKEGKVTLIARSRHQWFVESEDGQRRFVNPSLIKDGVLLLM